MASSFVSKFPIHLKHVSDAEIARQKVTGFQMRVYALTQLIPAGFVTTYGAMAKILQSSPRAVGQALKRNPFAPTVPCHRVISNSGLGGFFGHVEGEHLDRKVDLLKKEGVSFIESDSLSIPSSSVMKSSIKENTAVEKNTINFFSSIIDDKSILDFESFASSLESSSKGFQFKESKK